MNSFFTEGVMETEAMERLKQENHEAHEER
jgi:hypothetical protein